MNVTLYAPMQARIIVHSVLQPPLPLRWSSVLVQYLLDDRTKLSQFGPFVSSLTIDYIDNHCVDWIVVHIHPHGICASIDVSYLQTERKTDGLTEELSKRN